MRPPARKATAREANGIGDSVAAEKAGEPPRTSETQAAVRSNRRTVQPVGPLSYSIVPTVLQKSKATKRRSGARAAKPSKGEEVVVIGCSLLPGLGKLSQVDGHMRSRDGQRNARPVRPRQSMKYDAPSPSKACKCVRPVLRFGATNGIADLQKTGPSIGTELRQPDASRAFLPAKNSPIRQRALVVSALRGDELHRVARCDFTNDGSNIIVPPSDPRQELDLGLPTARAVPTIAARTVKFAYFLIHRPYSNGQSRLPAPGRASSKFDRVILCPFQYPPAMSFLSVPCGIRRIFHHLSV